MIEQLYFLVPPFHGISLPCEESSVVFSELSPEFLRVAAMLGITKRTFHHKDPVCLKFFCALALHDLVHEVPIAEVIFQLFSECLYAHVVCVHV